MNNNFVYDSKTFIFSPLNIGNFIKFYSYLEQSVCDKDLTIDENANNMKECINRMLFDLDGIKIDMNVEGKSPISLNSIILQSVLAKEPVKIFDLFKAFREFQEDASGLGKSVPLK